MCGSCNASYIGKTFWRLKVMVLEHQGVPPRSSKPFQGIFPTAVRDHMLDCNQLVAWDSFKVLGRESSHWLLEIKENLLTKRDRRLLFFFFLSGFSFTDTDNSQDSRGREGRPSHIFNRTGCIYQTATQWDLPPYRITIWLIDDVTLSFCLFTCWFDSSIFVAAI